MGRLTTTILLAAVRAMPRCEPPGFAPDDLPFRFDLDGGVRSAHIPRGWFDSGREADAAGDDPCLAEVRLAWWIFATFDRGPGTYDADAARELPPCSPACCAPDDLEPDPSGFIECCFCAPLEEEEAP